MIYGDGGSYGEQRRPATGGPPWDRLRFGMHQADRGVEVALGFNARTVRCGVVDLTWAELESLDGGPIDVVAVIEEDRPDRPHDVLCRSALVRWFDRVYPVTLFEYVPAGAERQGHSIGVVHPHGFSL